MRHAAAIVLIVATAVLTAGDLFAARQRGCGPHACCAKGACSMAAKAGAATLDRCGDDQAPAPQPATLTVVIRLAMEWLTSEVAVADGAPAGEESASVVERPPRA